MATSFRTSPMKSSKFTPEHSDALLFFIFLEASITSLLVIFITFSCVDGF